MEEINILDFYIILVEPKYPGNIGAVARAMANFDFEYLYLVNPCELDEECYNRAKHSQYILERTKIFNSFQNAIKGLDYLVATSSIESKNDKRHLRNALTLKEFNKKIFDIEGKIGLIFGREDYGLFNEEIKKCDIMVKIPTSENYPSLNLSHSVVIMLYFLYINMKNEQTNKRLIGCMEKEKIYDYFSQLLSEIDYPEHKKENTEVMIKRILGRAMPSKWEYHTLMGVISKTLNKIKRKK